VVKVEKGVAKFTNLGFAATPGSKDMKFTLWSSAVVPSTIIAAYGQNFYSSVNPTLTADFRLCTIGEEVVTGYC